MANDDERRPPGPGIPADAKTEALDSREVMRQIAARHSALDERTFQEGYGGRPLATEPATREDYPVARRDGAPAPPAPRGRPGGIPVAATEVADLGAPAVAPQAFLERLDEDDRRALEKVAREVSYTFGQVIIREGDVPDGVYFLLEGRARVVKQSGGAEERPIGQLEAGDVFGEGALLGTPRGATVRASGKVRALFAGLPELEKLLAKRPHLRGWITSHGVGRKIRTLLEVHSPFASVSESTLEALSEAVVPMEIQAGQLVFREGDAPAALFIVSRGRLRAVRQTPAGPRAVAYLREGQLFGVSSCLEQSPRKVTVEALTDCEVLALASKPFRTLYNASPRFMKVIQDHARAVDLDREAPMPLDVAELPRLTSRAEGSSRAAPDAAAGARAPRADGEERSDDAGAAKADRPGAVLAPTPEEPFRSADGYFVRAGRKKKRVDFVYQIDEMDCGAACLAMVCRYFGRRVSLGRIRSLAYAGPEGISLAAMVGAASELGLAARTVRVSKANVEKMPLPAIIHWEGNHWVVLASVSAKSAEVADPAFGVRRISRDELDRRWGGHAALFDFTESFEQNEEDRQSLAWVLPFLRPYWGVVGTSILLAGVVAGLTMLLPVLTQVVVDRVVVGGAIDALNVLLVTMAITFVFLVASRTLQGYLLAFVAVRIDAGLLDFLSRKLLALPMPYFLARRTGDIQQRLEGARQIRQLLLTGGVSGLLAVVQLIVAFALMTMYSPLLTGIYFAAAPFYLGLMFYSAKVLRPTFGKVEEDYGRYRSDQLDAIKGMEAVKAASAEAQFRDQLLERFLAMNKEQFRADFAVLTFEGALQAIGYLSSIAFLWVGAQLAMQGSLTIGGFVAFNALVTMSNQPMFTLLSLWDQYQRGQALLNRLADVFGSEPEQGRDRSKLIPVRTISSAIELRAVSFRYGTPDSPPVIRNVDLKVSPGETIAIVGRSGSGKTTLVKLLSGLLEPTDGTILFDGVDQRLLNYRDLRRHIGFVLQENHIFAGTVLQNIAFGTEPELERAVAAARAAAAHEFISQMPFGYATVIGETGIRLSGGQAQRVAIARALYKDPSIFIFDEATSALDAESERLIQQNLETYLANKTAFIIAHRLSTVRNATRIVVLERGEIVEIGSHAELMKRRGVYHELVSRQIEQ